MGGHRAVVETAGEYKFLTEDPRTLAANAKFTQLPMMGGVTEQDGAFLFAGMYSSLLLPRGLWNDTEYMENNFTSFSIKYLGIPDTTGAIRDSMINIYFNNGELGDFTKMVPGLIDIWSLFAFKAIVYDALYQNSIVGQNSYLFTFNYLGENTNSYDDYTFGLASVNHGDILNYLFPTFDDLSENDIRIVERMVQLWTNFATDGVPTADDVETWPAMSTRAGPYLIIDTKATTGDNFLDEYTATIRNNSSASSAFLLIPKPISIIVVTMVMLMLRYRI